MNVLKAIGANGMDGRRLREVAFPIIRVQKILAPRYLFPFQHGEEAGAGDIFWRIDAGHLKKGWHEVDVGNVLCHDSFRFDQFRTADNKWNADGFLVRLALVDKAVLAKAESVITGQRHHGRVALAALFQGLEDAPKGIIDGQKRLRVAFVVIADGHVRIVVGIADSMPTVALILHPHGPWFVRVLRHGGTLGHDKSLFVVLAFVAFRRNEIGVHGLVRKVKKIRLIFRLLVEPIKSVVGQFIGDVAFLWNMLAVHVQPVGTG